MKTLIVVLCLLFVSSIFAAPADWEGTYEWTGVGIQEAYNCYEDGWVFGTAGYILGWAAKVNDAGDMAHGNWWASGYKFGGARKGQTKNAPTTGYVRVTLNAPGDMTVEISYRGNKDVWITLPVGARQDTNVTDRIPTCGIMDPSSSGTLAGKWEAVSSSDNSSETAYYCLSNTTKNDFYASYKYENSDGDKVTGYLKGKCTMGGMVCRSDWSEYPMFGVQLDRLLIDGTKGTMWWDGPTAYIKNITDSNHGWFVSDLNTTDISDDDCSNNSDDIVYPFKCHTFDSTSDCEANPYYCKVSKTDDSMCVRIKWKSS